MYFFRYNKRRTISDTERRRSYEVLKSKPQELGLYIYLVYLNVKSLTVRNFFGHKSRWMLNIRLETLSSETFIVKKFFKTLLT